jgi:hypothetical protein
MGLAKTACENSGQRGAVSRRRNFNARGAETRAFDPRVRRAATLSRVNVQGKGS